MGDLVSQQEMVEHYIEAYNAFDIIGMLRDLDEGILFENVAQGSVNLTTNGIEAFQLQAEKAKVIFKQRAQRIIAMQTIGNTTEVQIDYTGTLAIDLPNGMQAGDTISLTGKSSFRFQEGKIIHIRDES